MANKTPIHKQDFIILIRLGLYSIFNMAKGTQTAQTTCAKKIKRCIGTVFQEVLWSKPIQTKPSINCWVANKKGIAAKNISEGFFTNLILAAPTTVRMVKEAKLAVVEKHMFFYLGYEE